MSIPNGIAPPRAYAYTLYPRWFGGMQEATTGIYEMARETARKRGWRVAGVTMTEDGYDDRGTRFIAVVDYREGSCPPAETPI